MKQNALIVFLGLFFVSMVPALAVAQLKTREEKLQEIQSCVEELETRYKIKVVYEKQEYPIKRRTYGIEATNPLVSDLYNYLPILREFLLYPPAFVRATKLKRITLSSGVIFKSSQYEQHRAAVPDFEGMAMVYDVKNSKNMAVYYRHVLHHEFFHMVDYADDGSVYRDKRWAALNEDDFEYGNGGAEAYEKDGKQRRKIKGFVSSYAMTGVEEDKAETYAVMMVKILTLESVAEDDEVLQSKFVAMRKLLQSHSKSMNSKFWTSLTETRTEAEKDSDD